MASVTEGATTPAPGPAGRAPEAPGSSRKWVMAGAIASGLFLLLEALDAFIAVPLREISSAIVGTVLAALGFPVTRQGTILETPNVKFDVVPACSGSTTLRVLLFVTIVWCGIHPKLTPPRKLLAALLALPIAILANSFRVSILVVTGHLAGEEPGGFFHSAAGILAFAVAMAGSFALTDSLATEKAARPSRGRGWLIAQGSLLAFLSAPFAYWCAKAWGSSPLDRWGYVWVAGAIAAAIWAWRRAPADRSREGLGTLLFSSALGLLAVATVADVNTVKGIAILSIFLSLALTAKGTRFSLSMIPLAGIAYLGFPGASYQIQSVTVPLFGWGSTGSSLAAKAVLGIALAAATRLPFLRIPAATPPAAEAARARWAPVRLGLLAMLAALQGYYFSLGAATATPMRLELSYLQGGWEGRNHVLSASEAEFFDGRIWGRRYQRGGDSVDVLVTSTGGDRHRAHPPAYCLTGDGWTIVSETVGQATSGSRPIPVTRLSLRKEGRSMAFVFWFSDGTEERASYREMLASDTARRLTGRRTDWFLFRIMSEKGDEVLNDFLSTFSASIAPGRMAR